MSKVVPFALLVLVGCHAPSLADRQGELASLGWLGGTWRANDGEQVIEERWAPAAGGKMLGGSFTLGAGKLAGFELLTIERRGDGAVYVARPGGNEPGTEFALASSGDGTWSFENAAHDFPNVIRYVRESPERFRAELSGEMRGEQVGFTIQFERVER